MSKENPALQIVIDLGELLKQSLKDNGRYATGKTEAAIEERETGQYGAQLLAPAYIEALEKGRGPTGEGASSGGTPLIEVIKEWIAAKGLDLNPYAVTKSIHKKGYKGRAGVITVPLSDENIEKATDLHLPVIADLFASQVLEGLRI